MQEVYIQRLEFGFTFGSRSAPKLLKLPSDTSLWGTSGKERSAFQTLTKALSRLDERDRKLLVSMAQGMARRAGKP